MPFEPDTDPEIGRLQLERYRRMTPAEKLERVVDLNRTAEAMATLRLERTYGPLDERERELRLAALRLDRETMIRVFGWDPAERGL
jgi:hypothetical protein